MSSLDIKIVGCGAVGLACGYLMRRADHYPTHVSLTGRIVSEVPVTLQDGTRDRYAPRMAETASKVDATVIAVGPGRVAGARAAWGAGTAPGFIFCSHPEPQPGADLVFPLMSAELCQEHGLSIVAASGVDLSSPGDEGAALLLQRLGFGPVRRVSEAHFTGRALQTAAAYVVLLALAEGRLDAAEVRAALLLDVRQALSDVLWADGRAFRLPDESDAALAAFAAYFKTQGSAKSDVFARNLAALTGHGQRKLHAHLAPFRTAWEGRGPHAGTLAWDLIDHAYGHPPTHDCTLSERPGEEQRRNPCDR